jgi:hypothetical protein
MNKRPKLQLPAIPPTNNYVNQQALRAEHARQEVLRKNISSTYVQTTNDSKSNFNSIEDEFVGQFRCTYKDCNKRLRNNVAFMYHLWSHVASLKPTTEMDTFNTTNCFLPEMQQENSKSSQDNNRKKLDFEYLTTCPECLSVQVRF